MYSARFRFRLAWAILGAFGTTFALAQALGAETDFRLGDQVEVKRGREWSRGEIVGIREDWGRVIVRLEEDSHLPGEMPDDIRVRFLTRPYRIEDVRAITDRKRTLKSNASRLRTWTDRTGKFSVEARFDGVKDDQVGLVASNGKRIEVPLERLSEDDVRYVNELLKPTENPFQGAVDSADDVQDVKRANWRSARQVAPRSFPKWTFEPESAGPRELDKLAKARDGSIELLEIPGSKEHRGDVLGVYVADDGRRAVIVREGEPKEFGEKKPQYVELVDLKRGKSLGLAPLPPRTMLLDVLPDENLTVYRPEVFGFGRNGMLTVARIDDDRLTPLSRWEPYGQEDWEPRRDIESAWLLDGDRVMTLNVHGEALTVWDFKSAKAVANIPLGQSFHKKLALSDDRQLLAVIMSDGIAVIDLASLKHVATIPTAGESLNKVVFRGDNLRLVGLSERGATIWDLSNGDQLVEFYHPLLRSGHSETFWAGEFLLVDSKYLFDPERRILLWEYQGLPTWDGEAVVRGGRFWAVDKGLDRQPRMVTARLPHAAAMDEARRLPSADELIVVKPGDSVAIEVEIDPGIGSADEIRQSLADALQKAGLRVVDDSDLVVKAVCKRQERQTIRINMDNRFPVRESDIVERTITPHSSFLGMTLNGESLWERGYYARPGHMIYLEEGESLDQALHRLTRPNLSLFKNARFPDYVARPGKATKNGAYGLSRLTENGLVDDQRSRVGAAFE